MAAILILGPVSSARGSGAPEAIQGFAVSRPFFNPTFGQKIQISFSVSSSVRLTVRVLDRDGFVTRTLMRDRITPAGEVRLEWDGRNDRGEVVPDEAYSFKLDLVDETGPRSYFPANQETAEIPVDKIAHDPVQKLIRYELAKPSRVHVQAGSSEVGPRGETNGPVLKTIANRAPRPSGLILEPWDGLDESGTFAVPDLKNFVIAVAATTLPENSVITVGNRSTTFLEHARSRQGKTLLTRIPSANHSHHRGLTALEDAAPLMRLRPRDVAWVESTRTWKSRGDTLKISVSLEGPSAPYFGRQPGVVFVFLDERKSLELPVTTPPFDFSLPIRGLERGEHRVSVNWISEYGPVAVNSLVIWKGPERTVREGDGR